MYKSILIPVALDHKRDVSASLNVAQKLVDKGGKIIALHVIEEIPAFAVMEMPDNYPEAQLSAARKLLEVEFAGVSEITIAVVVGHAGRTIQSFAEEHGNDCIVIASHQPGIQDYFLGSTAAWVVRHVKCGVHVIR